MSKIKKHKNPVIFIHCMLEQFCYNRKKMSLSKIEVAKPNQNNTAWPLKPDQKQRLKGLHKDLEANRRVRKWLLRIWNKMTGIMKFSITVTFSITWKLRECLMKYWSYLRKFSCRLKTLTTLSLYNLVPIYIWRRNVQFSKSI